MIENDQLRPTLVDPESLTDKRLLDTTNIHQSLCVKTGVDNRGVPICAVPTLPSFVVARSLDARTVTT
jgi:hypothetical protein